MKTLRLSLIGLGVVACAPDFPYTRVLGPGHFELSCPGGFPQCAAMATNLCPGGYRVVGTKSGSNASGAAVQCSTSTSGAVATPCVSAVAEKELPKSEKQACSADYQCTATSSRCVSGACVVVPVVATPDEADRCMVGKGGSSDPVPMFPTESTLAEFLSSTPESRAGAFMTVTRLNGVWVDAGVRCHTLGQFARGRHVQLISGTFAGLDGWLETEQAVPARVGAELGLGDGQR